MVAVIDHLLDRTCTTRRIGRVSDGMGGWTETYADHLTGEPCRRSAPSPGSRTVADQLQAVIAHEVYLTAGADVLRGDQIIVDGYTLLVEATVEPSVTSYLKALCSQTQTGA